MPGSGDKEQKQLALSFVPYLFNQQYAMATEIRCL
jgi:hypothetical protein